MNKKINVSIVIVFFLLATSLFADSTKKTKSEINFGKLGKFTTIQTTNFSDSIKASSSDNKFKGKGILGKLAGKYALKSGKVGEIIDLNEMKIFTIDHKKKRYEVNPIQSFSSEENTQKEVKTYESKEEQSSDIKITRSEFKVNNTGETKTINQFPCTKYIVSWITEWENTQTGEKGSDRLETIVWTTPKTGPIQQCQKDEIGFSKKYMKKQGFDIDNAQNTILGTNWMNILSQMNMDGRKTPEANKSQLANEMKKLKGYPIITDGKFFAKKEGGPEEKSDTGGGIKGRLGGLLKKKLIKKNKNDGKEPIMTYYIEVLELLPQTIDASAFQVPANYKKK